MKIFVVVGFTWLHLRRALGSGVVMLIVVVVPVTYYYYYSFRMCRCSSCHPSVGMSSETESFLF